MAVMCSPVVGQGVCEVDTAGHMRRPGAGERSDRPSRGYQWAKSSSPYRLWSWSRIHFAVVPWGCGASYLGCGCRGDGSVGGQRRSSAADAGPARLPPLGEAAGARSGSGADELVTGLFDRVADGLVVEVRAFDQYLTLCQVDLHAGDSGDSADLGADRVGAASARHALDLVGPHVLRSEEHTSELQSRGHLVCRLLLEKKKFHNRKCSYVV